ncbi:MAG: peroxiredoxin [Salinisphaera sp.]|nr:peroxiredoxin [Salinisphaera sp.]
MGATKVGDAAPDFHRRDQNGEPLSLSEYRGKRAVVLYFYPRDDTPICTREACHFRDHHEDFTQAGAQVIGVSSDSEDSHRAFAARHGLPFRLVADTDGSLRKAYGAPKSLGLMPGRVTYVIDRDGIVRHLFNAQLAAQRHVDEALATIRGFAQG